MGQGVAAPPLGPGAARRANGAVEARRRRAGRRRQGERRRRPAACARSHSRRRPARAGPGVGGANVARAPLDVDHVRRAPARPAERRAGRLRVGARLSGVGRGLGMPTLAASADGASWSSVVTVAPDAAGAVFFDVKPVRSTRYASRRRAEPRRRCSCRSHRGSRCRGRAQPSPRSCPGRYGRGSREAWSRSSGGRDRLGDGRRGDRGRCRRLRLELDTSSPRAATGRGLGD